MSNWKSHENLIADLQGKWKREDEKVFFEIIGTGIVDIKFQPPLAIGKEYDKTYFTLEFENDSPKITNPLLFNVIKGDLEVRKDSFSIKGYPSNGSNGKIETTTYLLVV